MGLNSRSTSPDQPSLPAGDMEDDSLSLEEELREARDEISRLTEEVESLRKRVQKREASGDRIAELEEELARRTLRMEQQTAIAHQLQSLFNPPALPHLDGVNFCVKYQPSPRVGGDIYDAFDMGNGCVGLFVADVAGYGLTSILISAVAKMALDTFRQNEYSPLRIMEKVNQHMVRNTLSNQFLTAFLAVLDLETMKMKFVNAAHPCPVLLGEDRFELLDTEGLCCGMFDDPQFEEREIDLRPHDRVIGFTRGLLDTCNGSDTAYSADRLYHLLKSSSGEDIDRLIRLISDDVETHRNGRAQTEDLTLVGMQVVPRETRVMRVSIPSDPQQIQRVESNILKRLEALNYGERVLFGVRLALEEALINAIKHGNKMDKAKKVHVSYTADDRECVIHVRDEGKGFDPAAVPDPTKEENLELPHGRGLVLMRAYMDDVRYNESGNCVTLRKKAPWAE